jgi:hypothetical protein
MRTSSEGKRKLLRGEKGAAPRGISTFPEGKQDALRGAPLWKHDEKNNIFEGENAFFAWRWVFSPIASGLPARKQFHAGD